MTVSQTAYLSVTPEVARVMPGGEVPLSLTLQNMGADDVRFGIAVDGIPGGWCDLTQPVVAVRAGATRRLQLTIRPPGGEQAPEPGQYEVRVRVTDEDNPACEATAMASLTVAPPGDLYMDLSPTRARGRSATFAVTFHNRKEWPVTLELAAHDDDDSLLFRATPSGPVVVPGNSTVQIGVFVAPWQRRLIGPVRVHEIEFYGLQPSRENEVSPDLVRPALFAYTPPILASWWPEQLLRRYILALASFMALLLLLLGWLIVPRLAKRSLLVNGAQPTATALPRVTATAPAAAATASPTLPAIKRFAVSVGRDGTATVVWKTSAATQVRLDGQAVAASGQITLQLSAPTTMVLSATGKNGSATQILRVQPRSVSVALPPSVLSLPAIRLFSARTISATGHLALVWTVDRATDVAINGSPVPPAARLPITLSTRAITYTLTANNSLGSVTARLVLPATSPPIVQRFALTTPTIKTFTLTHPPGGYTLVWQTENAAAVTLNGLSVAPNGRLTLRPPLHTMSYRLIAANSAGATTATVRLTINASTSQKTQVFHLSLPRLAGVRLRRAGRGLVISWQVQGANRVWLAGTPVASAGERGIPPGIAAVDLVAANDAGTQRSLLLLPPTATPTASPTATPRPTGTPTKTATARPSTATATPRPIRTVRPVAVATRVPAMTATPRPTNTQAPPSTRTPQPTATDTPTPRPTATPRPTRTPRPSPTATPRPTRTPRPSPTATPRPTRTPRPSPTATPRPTRTPRPTSTDTPTPQPTATDTPTPRPTATPRPTKTPRPTRTPTPRPTATDSPTPQPSATDTATPRPTDTATPEPTDTATPRPTATFHPEPTPRPVPTTFNPEPTPLPTPTA